MKDELIFKGLRPAGLWKHFAAITQIPRPSGRETQISAYVQSWADRLGYPYKKDTVGNMCVYVPGTPKRTNAPVTVLQGHLDMVCERDSTSPYDAEQGNIYLVKDGDWIRAEGTTLGADNGIGLAAMLHAAESADIAHGPLDLLFTVDEETGLTGAQSLDPQLLRGRILLNLDNEDDGQLCVGCAGSSDATIKMQRSRTAIPSDWLGLHIKVSGLLGGHSGIDIVKPRLNAIRGLARLLQHVADRGDLRIVAFDGGNKRNAIPREASAIVCIPVVNQESAQTAIALAVEELKKQYAGMDDGLELHVEVTGLPENGAWSVEDSRCLFDLIIAIPCGVLAMNQTVIGLVETSNSIGTIETLGDKIQIGCLIRSSHNPAMAEVMNTIYTTARLAGADADGTSGYPGWQPNLHSQVLKVAQTAFLRVFKQEPLITAIHAGLECGIIGERITGIDMVSFGPNIKGPHAPGERVHIGSVERFWYLLTAVLDDLSREAQKRMKWHDEIEQLPHTADEILSA